MLHFRAIFHYVSSCIWREVQKSSKSSSVFPWRIQFTQYFYVFSFFFFFVRYLLKTILQDCLYWMLVEQLWKQQLEPRDNIPNYFQATPQHSQCSLVLLSEMSRCLYFHFRSSISLLCMLAPICRCVLCTDVTRCPWTPLFQPGQALSWSCW